MALTTTNGYYAEYEDRSFEANPFLDPRMHESEAEPLREAPVFAKASVGNYGAAVVWDDGDLAIDAAHLKMLADEQKQVVREN